MNKKQQKMLEKMIADRGIAQGCVRLSYELEGRLVQRWDVHQNKPAGAPMKLVRVDQAKGAGYLIVTAITDGALAPTRINGFTTADWFKVLEG